VRHRIWSIWCRTRDDNLKVIWKIWTGTYPPGQQLPPLTAAILTVPLVFRGISFSNLLDALTRWDRWGFDRRMLLEIFIFIRLVCLSAILFAPIPRPWWFVIPAGIVLTDILSYHLCVVLVDSQGPNWRPLSFVRSLVLALVGLYEIGVAFAIIYLLFGSFGYSSNGEIMFVETPQQAFYLSLTTLATVGSEFKPMNDLSRFLVILQVITQVVFILAVLPVIISGISMGGHRGT
jgi:hypothetical protein